MFLTQNFESGLTLLSYQQDPVGNLWINVSKDRLEQRTNQKSGLSCHQFGEQLLREETAKLAVVTSRDDDSQAYLATLSRNGISVSEKIPDYVFDDDIQDIELQMYWVSVRKRLSQKLTIAEQI